ncbi:MAG: alkaline shock response membrane anchor protein AmaP [Frankia sp.]
MSPVARRSRPYRARIDRLNRALLAVLGALLLAAGAVTLLAGGGVFGDDVSGRATLPPAPRDFAARHGWFWPVVGAGVGLVAAFALGWLLAQLERHRLGDLVLGSTGAGQTALAASALAGALRVEAGELPGVRRTRARFVRRPRRGPLLIVEITAEADADPAALRSTLASEVFGDLRTAINRPDLRTEVRLSTKRPPT